MYEQGVGDNLDGTPLGNGTSLGVHESQSRMWENIVGRSKPFWNWALPKLKATFPEQLGKVDLDTFYKAINVVKPSYIRVEADEATYNLHIMLRFELESEIIAGKVKVADLPEEWNDRFEILLWHYPAIGCIRCPARCSLVSRIDGILRHLRTWQPAIGTVLQQSHQG